MEVANGGMGATLIGNLAYSATIVAAK
jgi:hypothetical protein